MKLLIALFAFTKMLVVSEGNSFTFESRKCIDSTGTVEIDKRVKMVNDSVAVQRKGNKIYYYIR